MFLNVYTNTPCPEVGLELHTETLYSCLGAMEGETEADVPIVQQPGATLFQVHGGREGWLHAARGGQRRGMQTAVGMG